MKVLWFSDTPSLYDQRVNSYHGRGWIESLERLITEQQDIELAIAFFHPHDSQKVVRNTTTYYPIHRPAGRKRPVRKLISNWRGQLADDNYNAQFRNIIKDYQPDVIQVFGSEGASGDIQNITEIPVVIHLQGLINPCLNTYFPPGFSGLDFISNRQYFFKNIKGNSPFHTRRLFARQALREERILRNARHVMGRTQWDAMIARLYNPAVNYFHVDEVLRPLFYEPVSRCNEGNKVFTIISTLSPTVYKGIDVVLRAAKQLKALGEANFRWNIIGIESNDPLFRHLEKKEGILHQTVGIQCLGKKTPKELVQLLSSADVFVHPSYIDNSPNSVCEAQMLGLPVIACDVGGVASLLKHRETGILVPSNGVFEIVHYLQLLASDVQLATNIGNKANAAASIRHDRDNIVDQLKSAYGQIMSGS